MLDRLLTNRNFSLALIVALLLLLAHHVHMMYYSKNETCSIEGMQNVDLTPLAQELVEKPYGNYAGGYKKWNNKFDLFVDNYVKEKLKRNGYKYTDFLSRTDEKFVEYDKEGFKNLKDDEPKPASFRKEYSRCKPCDCESEKN